MSARKVSVEIVAPANTPKERKLLSHLRDLSAAVTTALEALDAEMRKPESNERGKRIAKLANDLDLANDRVRYFALGVDYRTDKKGARV